MQTFSAAGFLRQKSNLEIDVRVEMGELRRDAPHRTRASPRLKTGKLPSDLKTKQSHRARVLQLRGLRTCAVANPQPQSLSIPYSGLALYAISQTIECAECVRFCSVRPGLKSRPEYNRLHNADKETILRKPGCKLISEVVLYKAGDRPRFHFKCYDGRQSPRSEL